MRKHVTMRFNPDFLAKARLETARENRTLTSFVETVVRQRVANASPTAGPSKAAEASPTPCPVAGQDR